MKVDEIARDETVSPSVRVLTRAALKAIGVTLSNPTLCRMEKGGKFPRRFYLSAKCPVWDAESIRRWLAERQLASDPNGFTAKATLAAQTPEVRAARRATRAANARRRVAETIKT